MSYLVLARKFRPKTFGEMVGQGHVVQALENALTTQRLHHAYLFTGTRGVGKTTVSRILAKSLNCQGPDGQGGITATPCGVCQACKDIDSGRFVDYTELDAASNRGVDEVQSLLEQAVYKPVQGRFKVFMIDEVHMLTNTAFNAMLKTLEEPPEYLKFVLATTDPQKVPVTVLSRCLQFNLRPMAPETVLEHLTGVLQAEQVPAEPQALRLLARAARGSMRDALSLTDQAIAFGNGELLENGVRQMLGSVDRGHVFKLIEALAQGDGRTVVDTSEALRRDGMSAASTLEEMTAVLQAMAVLQAVPSRAESADSATDPDAADTARLASLMPADETQLLYSLCLHGRGELGLAPDEYAALTMVLLRLLAFKPSNAAASSASAEKKTLNEAARAVSAPAPVAPAHQDTAAIAAPPASISVAAPVPRSNPAPAGQRLAVVSEPVRPNGPRPSAEAEPSPAAEAPRVLAVPMRVQPPPSQRDVPRPDEQRGPAPPIPPSEDGDFWHATVTQMIAAESINALARELALQSQLVARDVDQWILRVERELLNQPSARDKLTDALAALGHGVKLAIEIGGVVDSPARRNKQAADERQRVAEEAIRSDPEVQMLMREFDAKIVPGTLKPA
ncbi:DNA polymerase III subunit gamma/tau [Variovorax paradoxus]|jgi:DNA polymerase-3 subunit gamma/tau|uniref:DNA polymerase III subunit gamma/tau n=1 Tax=Variovorax paradoxus TaxID=34073 RepID=UPI0029C64A41|nr:DNA polymerase III subunit gamma/tau [Variovorax paradoxus]WPH22773.1 DNA polymerase III subunit gamma/tau [Variovorax paradoxus]